VFAPRSVTAPQGVGYPPATVFVEGRNASHLVILDGERIEDGPIAGAFLDHRVPAGFHGAFVAQPQTNAPDRPIGGPSLKAATASD